MVWFRQLLCLFTKCQRPSRFGIILSRMQINNSTKLNNKGFSLIELLLVISIIAMISSVGAVLFKSSRGKARDSIRNADVKNVQTALNLYLNDFGRYPPGFYGTSISRSLDIFGEQPTGDAVSGWTPGTDCDSWIGTTGYYDLLTHLETRGYMKQLPFDPFDLDLQDPADIFPYGYLYDSNGWDYVLYFYDESTTDHVVGNAGYSFDELTLTANNPNGCSC